MSSASDLDLLVIVQEPVHRRALAGKIYRNLHGVGIPVDVVVVTRDDLLQFGHKNGTILLPALKEGIVIYEVDEEEYRTAVGQAQSVVRWAEHILGAHE